MSIQSRSETVELTRGAQTIPDVPRDAVSPRGPAVAGPTAPGVRRRERSTRASDVVALRRTGNRVPLFAFAGAGSAGQVYMPLAQALGSDQPVYALQPHALEGRGVPDLSIGMAARRYIRRIREIQPHGPYFLAGHSMGGLVALAVAQLLDAAGERVLPVTLIDTELPPRAAGAPAGTATTASGGAEWPGVAHTDPAPQSSRADLWRIRRRLLLAGTTRLPVAEQQRNFFELGMRVCKLHRPKAWDGPVLFVRSGANPQEASVWTSVLTGALTVTTLPADHNSLLRAPFVARIAADLQAVATTALTA